MRNILSMCLFLVVLLSVLHQVDWSTHVKHTRAYLEPIYIRVRNIEEYANIHRKVHLTWITKLGKFILPPTRTHVNTRVFPSVWTGGKTNFPLFALGLTNVCFVEINDEIFVGRRDGFSSSKANAFVRWIPFSNEFSFHADWTLPFAVDVGLWAFIHLSVYIFAFVWSLFASFTCDIIRYYISGWHRW